MANQASLRLQSKDEKDFEVAMEIAQYSGTIKTMLDSLGIDGGEGDESQLIPLPNVDSDILELVIKWGGQRQLWLASGGGDAGLEQLQDWEKTFLEELDKLVLFELVKAANYLDIKELLHLTTKFMADKVKGATADEVRNYFGIALDSEPES